MLVFRGVFLSTGKGGYFQIPPVVSPGGSISLPLVVFQAKAEGTRAAEFGCLEWLIPSSKGKTWKVESLLWKKTGCPHIFGEKVLEDRWIYNEYHYFCTLSHFFGLETKTKTPMPRPHPPWCEWMRQAVAAQGGHFVLSSKPTRLETSSDTVDGFRNPKANHLGCIYKTL